MAENDLAVGIFPSGDRASIFKDGADTGLCYAPDDPEPAGIPHAENEKPICGEIQFARGLIVGRVNHFEIHADDPERAIRFYQNCFGWKFTKWDGPGEYWRIQTGDENDPGINGGLHQRPSTVSDAPLNAFVCTIDVDDIHLIKDRIFAEGGTSVSQIREIPGIGQLAYFRDTEFNQFGIFEPLQNS